MSADAESAVSNAEIEALRRQCGDDIAAEIAPNGDLRIEAGPTDAAHVCAALRDDPALAFDYPADLTAWDTGEEFVVWYRLHSMARNRTATVRVKLPREAPELPSVTGIWPGMSWHERECFDLYGIQFTGHPDSGDPARMRILLPEDWEGFPFRKDYEPRFSGDPLHGPQERN